MVDSLNISQHVLRQFHIDWPAVWYAKSDNAGSYHGNNILDSLYKMCNNLGFELQRYDYNEPCKGKDQCDRIFKICVLLTLYNGSRWSRRQRHQVVITLKTLVSQSWDSPNYLIEFSRHPPNIQDGFFLRERPWWSICYQKAVKALKSKSLNIIDMACALINLSPGVVLIAYKNFFFRLNRCLTSCKDLKEWQDLQSRFWEKRLNN